jgi:muramidase (phage lysozyme)
MAGLKKKQLRTDLDLTPKQKMFVEILVQDYGTITQHEALKRAGYDCKDDNSAKAVASQLLNRKLNPHVAKYFDKRFEKELKKYESDSLRRFKRFERLSDKAEKKEQFAAAINAEYRSGQLAGAFIDRKEVTVTGLEGMSREQLEKKLEELSNKIDGYNAKTIEAKSEDVKSTQNG